LTLLAKGKWKGEEAAQVRLLERCLKAGADVNATGAQGSTPLLFAAHRGNLPFVQAPRTSHGWRKWCVCVCVCVRR